MFKTERMAGVVIAGAERHQRAVIEALHALKAVHIEEHDPTQGDPFFTLGRPLPEGEAVAKTLLRARGLQNSLGLADEPAPYELDHIDAAKEKVDAVSALVAGRLDELATLEDQVKELDARRSKLRRLAPLGLRLEELSGFRSIRAFVGAVQGDAKSAVLGVTDRAEVVTATDGGGQLVAAFVANDQAAAVEQALAAIGFSPIETPEGEGPIDTVIGQTTTQIGTASDRIRAIGAELDAHRAEHGPELLAAIEALETAREKASAPIAFASGPTSFVITGFVPERRRATADQALLAAAGHRIHVEWLTPEAMQAIGATHGDHSHEEGAAHAGHDHDHHEVDPADEPPIAYTHRSDAVKSFTMMVGLHSMPRYKEVDPTILMWFTFPLFFGLMVGDLGFGLLVLLVALYLRNHHIIGIGGPRVSRMLVLASIWTMVLGAVMFGEAFGFHFVDVPGTLSWEWLFGADWSAMYGSAVHATAHAAETGAETAAHGADDHAAEHLVLFGFLQLGYLSKLHDVSQLLLISIGVALVHLNLAILIGTRNAWVMHGVKHAIFGKFSWIVLQAGAGILAWGMHVADPMTTNIGWGVFGLAVVMLLIGEGAIAILELPKIFSNALSYTRLAAIGLSKAGMALAVNNFAFVAQPLAGQTVETATRFAVAGPIGALILLIGILVILGLGILAGSIHSMRLQLVEFFGWFYEGGGRPFTPFGARRQ